MAIFAGDLPHSCTISAFRRRHLEALPGARPNVKACRESRLNKLEHVVRNGGKPKASTSSRGDELCSYERWEAERRVEVDRVRAGHRCSRLGEGEVEANIKAPQRCRIGVSRQSAKRAIPAPAQKCTPSSYLFHQQNLNELEDGNMTRLYLFIP